MILLTKYYNLSYVKLELNNRNNRKCNRRFKINLYCKYPKCLLEYDLIHKSSFKIINVMIDRIKQFDKLEVPLQSVKLRKLICKNYKLGIKELMFKDIIGRKVLDSKTGAHYDQFKGICTSYYLKFRCLRDYFKNNYFFSPIQIECDLLRPKNGVYSLVKKSDDPKVLKILKNYQGIDIDSSWINEFLLDEKYDKNHYKYPNEPKNQFGLFKNVKTYVDSIKKKKISVKVTNSGRISHPIILISSIVRSKFTKDKEKLVIIDAKAFHPYLLASFIRDSNEQVRYLNLVKKDFYSHFVDLNCNRDSIKVSLQRYLANSKRDPKAKEIALFFEQNFPDISNKILDLKVRKSKTTMQMILQQLESKIFVEHVFMEANFWCLPLHDGLTVLRKDYESAIDLINKAADEILGYKFQIDTKSDISIINSIE